MDLSITFGFFLAWFITNNDYTRLFLEWLYTVSPYKVTDAIMEHASCMKCLTFWITLVHTQSLLFAIIASFIAYLYGSYIERD